MVPPKKVGDLSFYKFVATCIEQEWIVLIPCGDCDRYDCVIDRGNGLEKVQVKTGRLKNGAVHFATCSSHYHTKKGQWTKHFRRDYCGQVDLFGVYCEGRCYLVPIGEVGKTACSLRVEPPAKNWKNIRWAKDYLL